MTSCVGPIEEICIGKENISAGALAMLEATSAGSHGSDLVLEMLKRPSGNRSPGAGKSIGWPALKIAQRRMRHFFDFSALMRRHSNPLKLTQLRSCFKTGFSIGRSMAQRIAAANS